MPKETWTTASQAGNEPKELIDAFNQTAATLRNTIEELSEERNKLSAILDTMADGVVVIEADGRIELMNRAGEDILNANAKPRSAHVSWKPCAITRFVMSSPRRCKPKSLQRGDIELLHRRRYLVAIAAPLTQEETSGVLLTLHDLTPIRQLETTRREFVSNVSHELRTPIASIKAMVETLQRGAMEDRQVAVDFMERIDRDIVRMNDIVSELLELSLLESGQMKLDVTSIDFIPFLEEIKARVPRRKRKQRGYGSRWKKTPNGPGFSATEARCDRFWPTCWTTPSKPPLKAAR